MQLLWKVATYLLNSKKNVEHEIEHNVSVVIIMEFTYIRHSCRLDSKFIK